MSDSKVMRPILRGIDDLQRGNSNARASDAYSWGRLPAADIVSVTGGGEGAGPEMQVNRVVRIFGQGIHDGVEFRSRASVIRVIGGAATTLDAVRPQGDKKILRRALEQKCMGKMHGL